MHVKTFMSGMSRKRVTREKQMAERSIKKSKRRLIFVALGLALAAAVAWLAVLRDTERPGRAAAREAPTASTSSTVASASNVGTRTTPNEASGRVMAEGAGTSNTESVPVSPRPASVPVTESPSNATADTALPVRRASDSGRAQPVFIGLRAPQTVRVGEPFRIDVTGESENDFARVALAIRFDPRLLRVASAQQGDLMARAGAGVAFSYAVDAQTGRVSIELNENEGRNPVSGGGTLCSVEFIAIAPGRVPLSISEVAVEDLDNERVAYSLLPPSTVAVRE